MTKRSSSVSAQPCFTAEQREKLKKLGLFDEQITELNGILLLIQKLLGSAAPLAEVRDKLKEIERPLRSASRAHKASRASRAQQALERAHNAISRLATLKTKSAIEATNRMIGADDAPISVLDERGDILKRTSAAIKDGEQLPEAIEAVDQMLVSIARACDEIPREQRRGGAFPLHQPVERINRALMDGFLKHHNPNFPHTAGKLLPPAGKALPRVTHSGNFSEIVDVCYEAAGGDVGADHSRAIKQYIDLVNERQHAIRTRMGMSSVEAVSKRKRGRPPN